jgi:TfoX/Sxy family transcriptional regulator of competence genes
MAREKIGEVQTTSYSMFGGKSYEVYWDKDEHDVYVAGEFAGKASSKDEAMLVAKGYTARTEPKW